MTRSLEHYKTGVDTLFLTLSISQLKGEKKAAMLHLLQSDPSLIAIDSPADDVNGSHHTSDNGDNSERCWDEAQTLDVTAVRPADDVNAASLAYDEQRRSYLGICSIGAILRTIFRLYPLAKAKPAQCSQWWPKVGNMISFLTAQLSPWSSTLKASTPIFSTFMPLFRRLMN